MCMSQSVQSITRRKKKNGQNLVLSEAGVCVINFSVSHPVVVSILDGGDREHKDERDGRRYGRQRGDDGDELQYEKA